MLEYVFYCMGFLMFTLVLQYVLYKLRKNHNKGKFSIWTGTEAALIICVIGLLQEKVVYLAAVVGFIIADEIGKAANWH